MMSPSQRLAGSIPQKVMKNHHLLNIGNQTKKPDDTENSASGVALPWRQLSDALAAILRQIERQLAREGAV